MALDLARRMRREATPAERLLWQALRARQSEALKFRKQVPFGPYVADFYCAAAKLVIEVDGATHAKGEGDITRDAWFRQRG
ncbi:MAG TPA: endonuclease domain-containing protein, partial [Acetobacteraceae bacterium]